MKLTDPTDIELGHAFGAHVLGWKNGFEDKNGHQHGTQYDEENVDWVNSADAIMPILAKVPRWEAGKSKDSRLYTVHIQGPCSVGEIRFSAEAEGFAKAAVIALLRWNGVEVEFSK